MNEAFVKQLIAEGLCQDVEISGSFADGVVSAYELDNDVEITGVQLMYNELHITERRVVEDTHTTTTHLFNLTVRKISND